MSEGIQRAALSLQQSLGQFPWFRMVGVGLVDGNQGLIVYTRLSNKGIRRLIPSSWEGYPVTSRRMGNPVPMASMLPTPPTA